MSNLTELLKKHEGVKYELYKCTADKWTIGVGRNLEDVGISEDEADYLLQNDIERTIKLMDDYIPWHDDDNHSAAFSVYLTPDWKFDYGGLFQYNLTDSIKTILPQQNTGVYQYGGVPHSTTIQAENSPIRKSIQCWFKRRKTKKTVI